MIECEELEKIVVLEPSPEMNDEWNELSEYEQDNMSYNESLEYYADLEGYRKAHDEHNLKMAKHLISCNNERCKEVCKNWEEDTGDLDVFIKKARSQA